MGPCPAGQSCQQMILSGGARQNSCQPSKNPQEILDPSDDGWPMSEDEITDALYEHCGTYYANDSGGRCVDINTDDISPFTLCSGAGGGSTSCCSSTLYCQLAFEDVVDLEPADKEDEQICLR